MDQIRNRQDLQILRQCDPYFAGTLAKGLLILKVFADDPRPYANSELAERLGIPRPTVSRLCRTLQRLGLLDHDRRLNRYFIGPAAVTLAYPYVINTPLIVQLRPALQSLATRFEGAVSVGVAMDLDVVYLETCVHEMGTLKRPGVGALLAIMETAMGRAWLAQLTSAGRDVFLARVARERPEEYSRCIAGVKQALSTYSRHGFTTNTGDAGLGVLAVGVASRIRYGPRQLLFNCAVQSYRTRPEKLVSEIGPHLLRIVTMANHNTERDVRFFGEPRKR